MGDTNYFSGTVKILENPVQRLVKKKILITILRGEVFQTRQNRCISLVFWGKLATEIKTSYKKNDYILIEGYISLKKSKSKLNKIIITGLKAHPFFFATRKKRN